MFRTGWMTRPAEKAVNAASISAIRGSQLSAARTSSSPRYITTRRRSPRSSSVRAAAARASGDASRAGPLDAARLEPPAKLLERGRLDLPHALPRHAETLTDRLESHGPLAVATQAEAIQDDLALLLGQVVQQLAEVLLTAQEARDGGAGFDSVGNHVLQVDVLPFPAHRRLQRQRHLRGLLERLEVLHGHAQLRGDVGGCGRLAALLGEPLPSPVDLAQLRLDVDRQPDEPRLVGERALDRLADPPGRVRREPSAAIPAELLDGADEPEVALGDEIAQRQPTALVAAGEH